MIKISFNQTRKRTHNERKKGGVTICQCEDNWTMCSLWLSSVRSTHPINFENCTKRLYAKNYSQLYTNLFFTANLGETLRKFNDINRLTISYFISVVVKYCYCSKFTESNWKAETNLVYYPYFQKKLLFCVPFCI